MHLRTVISQPTNYQALADELVPVRAKSICHLKKFLDFLLYFLSLLALQGQEETTEVWLITVHGQLGQWACEHIES